MKFADNDGTNDVYYDSHHHAKNKRNRWLIIAGVGVVILLLLAAFITFLVLYLNEKSSNNNDLPKWPEPSLSHMGKYAQAGVAADNQYCSEIGRDVLLHGGNAVDAAIATLFCIGVMDTHSTGLGGGHFMTIYNATSKKCHVVDAREVAPLAATADMYKNSDESQFGFRAVAVPGQVHGLWTEYSNFGSGKIPWKDLVQPTIDLLTEGYPVSHVLEGAFSDHRKQIFSEPTLKQFINPDTNDLFKTGDQIKTRTALRDTHVKLAASADPISLFYKGDMAQKMIDEFQAGGGIMTMEDLAQYTSILRDDQTVLYTKLKNGRIVCGPPPPSGAAVVMSILNIMDGYSYDNIKTLDDFTTYYHHFIEASKFAYAGRSEMGDPAFVGNASRIALNITSPEFANWARSMITDQAHPDSYYGGSFETAVDHGTTSVTVIDKDGNAVSSTSSINLVLGALVISESTGILWNDDMDDFSNPGYSNYFGYPPSPSNFIVPKKRPQSSMSPVVIFNPDDPQDTMAIGASGGSTIISGIAGVAMHALWMNTTIKEAIDFPRLHNQLQPNVTQYEPPFPKELLDALTARGHTMEDAGNLTVVTAVKRSKDNQLYANSDFRKGEESGPAGY